MEKWWLNQSEEELEQMSQDEKADKIMSKYDRLKKRFKNHQPWFVRNAQWRGFAEFWSYVFNIVSALGMSYAVLVIFSFIPIPYANYVIAIIVLLGYEYIKRKFSDMFWDKYYATKQIDWRLFIINFVVLFALSLGGTAAGVYFFAMDNDPGAAQLRAELVKVEERIEHHETNKNKEGEIYWNSQKALPSLYAERDNFIEQIKVIEGAQTVTTEDNPYLFEKSYFSRYGSVGLVIILEFLFELCMAFMSRYDFVIFQLAERQKKKSPTLSAVPITGNNINANLVVALQKLTERMDRLEAPSANLSGMQENKVNGHSPTPQSNMQIDMPWANKFKPVDTSLNQFKPTEKEVIVENNSLALDRLVAAKKSKHGLWCAWRAKFNEYDARDKRSSADNAKKHMETLEAEIALIEKEIEAFS